MNKGVEFFIDLIILVVIMVLGLSYTAISINSLQHTQLEVKMNDKTTIASKGNNDPGADEMSLDTLLLMYVVADEYTPSNNKLQINDNAITTINQSWLNNKVYHLQGISTQLAPYNISTYYADLQLLEIGGTLRWKIKILPR